MKKILFGIMALSLSMAAFGAANASTTSVPVMVQCNVIAAPTGLVITDEAGQVLTELNIDHGNIVKPTVGSTVAADPTAYKIFKVQRYDNGAPVAIGSTDASTLKVSLKNGTGAGLNETLLKKDGTSTNNPLTSTLKLEGGANPDPNNTSYTETIGKTSQVHTGKVTSTIAKAGITPATATGLYNNARVNTLEVIYTP